MRLKCINRSAYELPKYATEKSAGLDLRANTKEPITIPPMGRYLVPTGLHIQLPDGYEGQVRPRSGLANRHGITVLNTPGTIDADYTGQIHALLINFGTDNFTVYPGDRIAQLVVAKCERVRLEVVDYLEKTERGEGGHGHTGIK